MITWLILAPLMISLAHDPDSLKSHAPTLGGVLILIIHTQAITTLPVDISAFEISCSQKYADRYFVKEWIGDGTCNPFLNNQDCGYDGGDCCLEIIDDTLCHDNSSGCVCHQNTLMQPTFRDTFTTKCTLWPFMRRK